MYRLKVLKGRHLAARTIGAQATEVAVRAGVLNRMAALARQQSVRITLAQWEREFFGQDLIYTTTPYCRVPRKTSAVMA